MDKALICKIEVAHQSGKRSRGTGYVIARDRIITAAHVVKEVAEQPHAIELYFGEGVERLMPSESPNVLWNGRIQGCNGRMDVDVAVLQCVLPEELRPRKVSLAEGKCGPLAAFGCGYSGAGVKEKENGQYDFSGTFPMVTGDSHQASVDVVNGPRADNDDSAAQAWGGMSGASLFEREGQHRIVGIATSYVRNHESPRLSVVPMSFLLRDLGFRAAIRFEETCGVDSLNRKAREKLRVLAERILKQSDSTRLFILKCNGLPESLTATELASKIFDSNEPMVFLRRCVREEEYKREFERYKSELGTSICQLVELISPIAFALGNLSDLEQHLNRRTPHAEIATQDLIVAKSHVAFIKRVSVNLQDGCDWESVSHSILPSGKKSVTSLPHPPELGIFADGAAGREDIVEMFQASLFRILRPESHSRVRVQAALADQSQIDELFFCVLFPSRLSDDNLRRLNAEFPELVLLTSTEANDAPHQRVLDQIQRIREEFGPHRLAKE